MSDDEKHDDSRSGEQDLPATASFSGLRKGPGSEIGQFRIESELGRGGMGVVYLAHDSKLERAVAIKSLPSEIMDNPQVRLRLKREAKLLASLNHPNIATIHDVIEEENGAGYLVLEYVAGETLGERIGRGRLKLKETLSIAKQVAEGISAAHEQGVIHRDLKPGNIKITPKGKVKVLDFGLAKAVGTESADQQTTITEPGKVIGTPGYMSPEQARGQPTDQRSDIWSFGCVLYEMVSGRLPFRGETISDTLANILNREPDWQSLPADTPENIRVLLRRCLEKDVHQRLQHIGDARIEIAETLDLPASATSLTLKAAANAKPRRRSAMIIGAAIVIIVLAIASRFLPDRQDRPSSKLIRIVVLPFENLGSAEKEYYADGITNEITSRLARLHGLSVISPRTAMQYKKTGKNAQVIGKELGVEYILEGLVQFERPSDPNSPMRVMPRLIRASDDTLLLAPVYHENMSEVFRVQSEVAERVAQALDITLLEPERRALAARPTENLEAWDYYLRGNEYLHRTFDRSAYSIAIQMYDKAVELDTGFALAYAQLSRAHLYMYWLHDHTKERLTMAEEALNEVLELAPDLPEAHLALGHYYYHGHMDYDRALEQFAIVRKSQPNSSELMSFTGYVQRRQGKMEQAAVTIEKALELDPRSAELAFVLGETFLPLRKYPEAERYFDRAISLAPDWPRPYAYKVQLYLTWQGNTEKARVALEEALENIDSVEDRFIILMSVLLSVFDGDYQEALDRLSSCKLEAFDTQFYFIPKALLCAQINGLMGNSQLEQGYYNSACSMLESKIEEDPNDGRLHSSLGIAYAGLGRKEDAIREGKRGTELLPVTKEAMKGLFRVESLARIYAMIGDYNHAIEKLKYLLSRPSELSPSLLKLDPVWAPLRGRPGFEELLKPAK